MRKAIFFNFIHREFGIEKAIAVNISDIAMIEPGMFKNTILTMALLDKDGKNIVYTIPENCDFVRKHVTDLSLGRQ